VKEEDIAGIILGVSAAAAVVMAIQHSVTPIFSANPFTDNPRSSEQLIVDPRLQSPSVDVDGPAIFGNTYSATNVYGRYGR
jgi:hypothetical protein